MADFCKTVLRYWGATDGILAVPNHDSASGSELYKLVRVPGRVPAYVSLH